nr:MAG TPA: Minor capsid protein from bacteriophage [Caudoviricetes sp.]
MIIKALRDYISQCPYLYEFNKGINVDYLDNDSTTYSIEEVPCNPIIKKYLDGSSEKQYDFIFASRESYGADVLQNIENSGFYEDFSNWIEQENAQGNLPILEATKEAVELKISTTGYAFQTDENSARYQIQLKLIYLQKGGV